MIDFEEFCAVMKKLTSKKSGTLDDLIRPCFEIFDRVRAGFRLGNTTIASQMNSQAVSEDDFRNILRDIGGIVDEAVIDTIFAEVRSPLIWAIF